MCAQLEAAAKAYATRLLTIVCDWQRGSLHVAEHRVDQLEIAICARSPNWRQLRCTNCWSETPQPVRKMTSPSLANIRYEARHRQLVYWWATTAAFVRNARSRHGRALSRQHEKRFLKGRSGGRIKHAAATWTRGVVLWTLLAAAPDASCAVWLATTLTSREHSHARRRRRRHDMHVPGERATAPSRPCGRWLACRRQQ